MAITVVLKNSKKNKIRLGILGISWTILFFGLFIPLLRRDWKIFLPFFLVYLSTLYFMPFTFSDIDGVISWQMVSNSGFYSGVSFLITFVVHICGMFFYNKIYTQGLVNRGYLPVSKEGESLLQMKGIILPTKEYPVE